MPPDMMQWEGHGISLIVFLPELHKFNLIRGSSQTTQIQHILQLNNCSVLVKGISIIKNRGWGTIPGQRKLNTGLSFRWIGKITIKKMIGTKMLSFLNLIYSGYLSDVLRWNELKYLGVKMCTIYSQIILQEKYVWGTNIQRERMRTRDKMFNSLSNLGKGVWVFVVLFLKCF